MEKRIEAHLLGLEVPSLDFGIDQEFIDIKHRENNQVFDQQNYEKIQDQAKLNSMSKYGRQQEMLFRMKQKEQAVNDALKDRYKAISEAMLPPARKERTEGRFRRDDEVSPLQQELNRELRAEMRRDKV